MSEQAQERHRIGILGSGFTSVVAANLIEGHPECDLAVVTSRSQEGRRFDEVCAGWGVPLDAPAVRLKHPANLFEDPEDMGLDAALVTYSGAESIEAVADLRSAGIRVVHLGGDLRLRDPEVRRKWYGGEADDEADELLAGGKIAYGLTELYRDEVKEAEIVTNPGCYPTASVLGLAPLAGEGLVSSVRIDAYSGTSGGGLGKAEEYATARRAVIPYGQDGHRHQPEIAQELAALGSDCTVDFQPHVTRDVFQGMAVHCEVTPTREIGIDELLGLYRDAYRDEPFVEVAEGPIGLDAVRGTNLCQMLVGLGAEGRVVIAVYIDNLWKGASGEAVQNLNLMLGLPETAGLPASELERSAG